MTKDFKEGQIVFFLNESEADLPFDVGIVLESAEDGWDGKAFWTESMTVFQFGQYDEKYRVVAPPPLGRWS